MKPYYEHAGITIYHGDCREVLPTLPQEATIVTDWPYGIGVKYPSFNDTEPNVQALVTETWPEIVRRPRAAMFCGVRMIGAFPRPTWILNWFTPAGSGHTPWGFGCWQPILVYGKDPHISQGCSSDTFVWQPGGDLVNGKGENGHVCPKPIKVMRWLVVRTTHPYELVIDPCMGSGTTLEAAKQLSRRAIGIEIEERYCEIAAKRLAQEVLPLEFAAQA